MEDGGEVVLEEVDAAEEARKRAQAEQGRAEASEQQRARGDLMRRAAEGALPLHPRVA